MKVQLVKQLNQWGNGSCRQELTAFRDNGFRRGVVFSDGTKPTQSSLPNISAPGQCWWPVLAANAPSVTWSGETVIYVFCQAQAVCCGMPWPTHRSRVLVADEDASPPMISSAVIEELDEEDEDLEWVRG